MKRTGLAALLALCLGVAARAADAPAPVAPSDVAAAPAPSSTPATTAPATSGTSSAPAATDAATANPQPVPAASPPPPKPQPAATASAPPAPLPPVSPYEKIHTVAIVSAIGTPVTLQNDHITGSTTKTLDGSDWKIDDQVASTLGQYLAGRFAIKDIAFDRAAFAKLPNDSWEKIDPQVSAFLASLPSAGVDAFVIVRPELDGEPGLAGLALEIGGAMGARPPTLWANYEIDIVDAQTHAILGRAHSCIQPRAGMPVSPAEILAAADLNLGDDLAPGDQQRTELKTGLSRLVSMSLLETVRALNLGAALPPVGTRNVVPVPDGQQPFPDVKTVAIVSAVGDVLQFEHVGATALSSNEEYLPIADWHLDGQIESQAKGILAKRFAVKEVAVDRAAFAGARLVNADRALRPSFPGLTPSTDVDAYIVFVKQPYRLPKFERRRNGCRRMESQAGIGRNDGGLRPLCRRGGRRAFAQASSGVRRRDESNLSQSRALCRGGRCAVAGFGCEIAAGRRAENPSGLVGHVDRQRGGNSSLYAPWRDDGRRYAHAAHGAGNGNRAAAGPARSNDTARGNDTTRSARNTGTAACGLAAAAAEVTPPAPSSTARRDCFSWSVYRYLAGPARTPSTWIWRITTDGQA